MKTLTALSYLTFCLLPISLGAASATLSINAASTITTFIPKQAFGTNTSHSVFLSDEMSVVAPVQAAGINFMRYPGGSGSDVYHWNGTGSYAGNVWVPDNVNFSPGFTCKALNIGTSASGISALTDGLTGTAWISNPDTDFPAAQWAYVDLGSQQSMNQVQVWWSTPYATSFQVQYWDPAASNQWSPYVDTASHWLNSSAGTVAGSGGQQTVNFSAVSARYLRLLLQASSAPGGGYAIGEIKVFNGATQLTTNTSSSSQSQSTASSTTVTSAMTGPTASDFDKFMSFCNSFSPAETPLITVNFGTGTPQEAAAWVHYANVVKGYHVRYWEIGNEMMGNWETGGPLSATDYGRRFIEYYNAMTAEDPSIKLLGPVSGPVDPANNLNTHTFIQDFSARLVSAGVGADLGGVDIHVYAGYNDDTDAALLPSPASWSAWASSVNTAIAGLPSPSTLPVVLSEFNANSAGTNITVRLVNAVWVVHWLGEYLKSFGPRAWSNFFAMLSSGGEEVNTAGGTFSLFEASPGPYQYQPFATYWALQMLSADWAIAQDTRPHTLVSCASTAANLVGYADLRPDGALSLIVVNQDSSNAYSSTVQISGFTPLAAANTYSYSSANYQWQTAATPYHASPNTPPTQAVFSGVSGSFAYSFPAYSITVFQFEPAGTPTPTPTAPSWTATPTPSLTQTSTVGPTACATKVAYNGETGAGNLNLAASNFYTTSASAVEDAAALHAGAKGLDITYNWGSYWSDFSSNFANYNPAKAYDLSNYDTMEFWVRSTGGTLAYLFVGLDDSSSGSSPIGAVGVNTYLPGGVTSAWQRVEIPLSAFTGVNKAGIWAFDLYISGLEAGNIELYVDDVVFLQHCSSPTPSPSPSVSRTSTASPSPSRTPTASPSATVSGTPTPSATGSPSQSQTPSETASPTALGTFTDSPTPSLSPTPSASPNLSLTLTESPTPTSSPSDSATVTPSPSATASSSPTLLLTATTTMTATSSYSPSVQTTATATATLSVTMPAAGTATSTAQITATPVATIGQGSNRILKLRPAPNPNPQALYVLLDGQADAIHIRAYSPALACIRDVQVAGSFQGGWNKVSLPTDWSLGMANGIYFIQALPMRRGLEGAGSGSVPAFVLR